MAGDRKTTLVAPALTEEQRQLAMERFAVLRPHLEEDLSLARAAHHAGLRFGQRWLSRYRHTGFAGLARSVRSDADAHRLPTDLIALIEGLGLKKPRSSTAAIHRRMSKVATAQGWHVLSYSTVYAILVHPNRPVGHGPALDWGESYRISIDSNGPCSASLRKVFLIL